MKSISRYSFFLFFLLLSGNCIAQISQLKIARNSIAKLNPAISEKADAKKQLTLMGEGIKALDAAEKDKRTQKWPETWAIKAYLSSYIALIDANEANATKYFQLAKDALEEAEKLDKYNSNTALINAADYNIHARIQREGAKAFSTGDYASAFQLLKQVSDFLPKDTLMAVNVGLSAQNLSHYNDALTYFLRAKENGIKNPAIYQQLANIYSSKFENELAIQTLKDGLKLNPNNQFLINDYINLLLNNDKFEEASTSISNLLGDDSQNRLYYYLQGYLAQNHQQNLASAETYYLKALALEHDFFAATYQLGLVYLSMANTDLKNHQAEAFNKNIERAFASLDRAYEINPHHRNTIQLLIDIYTRKNRFDKVQELRRQLNEF